MTNRGCTAGIEEHHGPFGITGPYRCARNGLGEPL